MPNYYNSYSKLQYNISHQFTTRTINLPVYKLKPLLSNLTFIYIAYIHYLPVL